jgi:hypothetical protein
MCRLSSTGGAPRATGVDNGSRPCGKQSIRNRSIEVGNYVGEALLKPRTTEPQGNHRRSGKHYLGHTRNGYSREETKQVEATVDQHECKNR